MNYVALAVPLFLGFILIEYLLARRSSKPYFDFANSISNLNVGIAERLSDVFVTGLFYFIYDYLYQHYAIFHFQPVWYNWLLLLLATDFLWYWYHRFGHEVNLLWGLHVVHHQSPEFNYTASVRVTVFQAVARTCFWSFLPILGFPAHMITSILLIHGLYPFFVHTRLIGKLGWLEYIMVTPSHHRVHHASNDEYLDKNYGDVFIVWDRLFGTFKEEKAPPVFGLTKPLNSYSFLWQHFHFLLEIWYTMRKQKGFRPKMRILFGPPDLIAPETREILERRFRIQNPQQRPTKQLSRYVLYQMAGILTFLFLFLLFEHQLGFSAKILAAGLILTTVINCGAILEQRQWIFKVEVLRALFVGMAALLYFPTLMTLVSIAAALVYAILYYQSLQQGYLKLVYKRL